MIPATLTSLTSTTYAFGTLGVCLLDRRRRKDEESSVFKGIEHNGTCSKKIIEKNYQFVQWKPGNRSTQFYNIWPRFCSGPKVVKNFVLNLRIFVIS
jgi:hypothetical protein